MLPTILQAVGLVSGVLAGNMLTHYYPLRVGMIIAIGVVCGAIGYGIGKLIEYWRARRVA